MRITIAISLCICFVMCSKSNDNTASLTLINNLDKNVRNIAVEMSKTKTIQLKDSLNISRSETFIFRNYQDDSYIIKFNIDEMEFKDTLGYLIGGYVFLDTGIIKNDSIGNTIINFTSKNYENGNVYGL